MFQLPKALPDELLLSRSIRFATISGISSSVFLQSCFGSKKTSLHPFLTSGLSSIARLCNENRDLLLREQTLAPLFCLFLPCHAQNLQKMMLTNNGAKAFRASQLTSFGSGQSLSLKSCPLCAQQDLLNYGVSYWHRSHQIPGVCACGHHGTELSIHALTQRQRIIRLLLPNPDAEVRYSSPIECKVANFSTKLLSLITARVQTSKITDIYRYYLNENGFLTQNGRVRRKAIMQDFCKAISNHSGSNPALIPRGPEDFRYVSQLLQANGSHHPYRHLLFGSWLLVNAEKINWVTDKKNKTCEETGLKEKDEGDLVEQKCLEMLRAGKSLAQVSKLTNKSRCYLKRIASLNNVRLNLKPKEVTPKVLQMIYRLALRGFHRKEIGKRCNIKTGSVEQVISSIPGLVSNRKRYRFESRRRKNRCRLLRFLEGEKEATQQDIRQNCPATFYWLYLNDKDWLYETLPPPKHPIAIGRIKKNQMK